MKPQEIVLTEGPLEERKKTFGTARDVGKGKERKQYVFDHIPLGYELLVYGDVTIKGNVGSQSIVHAYGKIKAEGKIENGSKLEGDSVEAKDGGEDVTLVAHATDINAGNFGDFAQLRANGNITIDNAASCLHAKCNEQLAFKRIENDAILRAGSVRGGHVHDKGLVTTTNGDVQLDSTGEGTKILSTIPSSVKHPGKDTQMNTGEPQYEENFTPRKNPAKVNTQAGNSLRRP